MVLGVAARVAGNDGVDFAGIHRDIPSPASESAMRVDGLDPFGEEPALGPVAVAVSALGFEHQHVARREPDEEVIRRFPSAVEDAEVDVAPRGGRAGLARKPSAHVACRADWLVPVENRLDSLCVLVADGFPDMLNHLVMFRVMTSRR